MVKKIRNFRVDLYSDFKPASTYKKIIHQPTIKELFCSDSNKFSEIITEPCQEPEKIKTLYVNEEKKEILEKVLELSFGTIAKLMYGLVDLKVKALRRNKYDVPYSWESGDHYWFPHSFHLDKGKLIYFADKRGKFPNNVRWGELECRGSMFLLDEWNTIISKEYKKIEPVDGPYDVYLANDNYSHLISFDGQELTKKDYNKITQIDDGFFKCSSCGEYEVEWIQLSETEKELSEMREKIYNMKQDTEKVIEKSISCKKSYTKPTMERIAIFYPPLGYFGNGK
ncbi:MAG: hypothetical protein DRP06_02665 [Candidatus Aenigmatarchaeota archaeon]|nr:MAG: hypothetical protein DRP06_02665 [Candidatus Aenigmarchaeota archaeon]